MHPIKLRYSVELTIVPSVTFVSLVPGSIGISVSLQSNIPASFRILFGRRIALLRCHHQFVKGKDSSCNSFSINCLNHLNRLTFNRPENSSQRQDAAVHKINLNRETARIWILPQMTSLLLLCGRFKQKLLREEERRRKKDETKRKPIPNDSFPEHYFKFAAYNEVQSKADMHGATLTDYVAHIHQISDPIITGDATRTRTRSTRRIIDIQNLDGINNPFVIWSDMAENFDMDDYAQMQKPVVIAVSSTWVTTTYGDTQTSSTRLRQLKYNDNLARMTNRNKWETGTLYNHSSM
nr:nucleic acid-binding, OB-fold protein [Tanacetum cinerariifolium]